MSKKLVWSKGIYHLERYLQLLEVLLRYIIQTVNEPEGLKKEYGCKLVSVIRAWLKLPVLLVRMMSKMWTQLYSVSCVGYEDIFSVWENLISLQKYYILCYVSHNAMPYGQYVKYVMAKVL